MSGAIASNRAHGAHHPGFRKPPPHRANGKARRVPTFGAGSSWATRVQVNPPNTRRLRSGFSDLNSGARNPNPKFAKSVLRRGLPPPQPRPGTGVTTRRYGRSVLRMGGARQASRTKKATDVRVSASPTETPRNTASWRNGRSARPPSRSRGRTGRARKDVPKVFVNRSGEDAKPTRNGT